MTTVVCGLSMHNYHRHFGDDAAEESSAAALAQGTEKGYLITPSTENSSTHRLLKDQIISVEN